MPKSELIEPGQPPTHVKGLSVDDATTLTLSTLQVKVFLRQGQVADPQLAAALMVFRRAANVLAHLEDEIVFKGQPEPNKLPVGSAVPGIAEVLGGEKVDGLSTIAGKPSLAGGRNDLGERLVSAVSDAVGALERRFQTGPFGCVLARTTSRSPVAERLPRAPAGPLYPPFLERRAAGSIVGSWETIPGSSSPSVAHQSTWSSRPTFLSKFSEDMPDASSYLSGILSEDGASTQEPEPSSG